ncbi:MAG: hypothetical protein ACI9GB_003810, partial [Halioglobus sp.]
VSSKNGTFAQLTGEFLAHFDISSCFFNFTAI